MQDNYLGRDTKKLGFGLMRLPMNDEKIDIEHTNRMVDMFIEKGFTYFDTAYGYINGQSEPAAKVCLINRHPRDSFTLATKLPIYSVKETADCQRFFDEQLERTGAGYFDFYLLHGLGKRTAQVADEKGGWDLLHRMKAEGKIRHIGFSFHDKPEVLDDILTKHPEAEFVQLQINYADWEDGGVEARRCYEIARKHGKPVTVMTPIKGGSLTETLHSSVADVFKQANPNVSLASWALRFAMSLDGIITVLSGMSNIEQMTDNINIADMDRLNDDEYKVIAEAVLKLNEIPQIPCTDCKYCIEDCPQKINIPAIFSAFNSFKVYGNSGHLKWSYSDATREAGKASACIACGVCERRCPQKIGIIDQLAEVAPLAE